MRSRRTVTAACALAAATILAVAACGESVSGSAQANTSAAGSVTLQTTTSASSTGDTTTAETTTDPRLTSLLSERPTALSLPGDLTFPPGLTLPTDLSLPSDLSDLTDLTKLDLPGLAPGCVEVASAYAQITLALLPALFGGTEGYDAGQLEGSLSTLRSKVPAELAPDIKTLSDAAAEANGKSLDEASKLFDSGEFTTAQNNIDGWITANCNG